MHELGIMYHVVETVEKIARENNVSEIESLVLQIGQLSAVIPQYIEACYPAATDGSMLESTELVIEIIPANGRCNGCESIYNLVENRRVCPNCGGSDFEMLSGREFNIKEIVAC